MNFISQVGIVSLILLLAVGVPLMLGYGHLFRKDSE